jgi:3-hydroxybutyryl-CoA dehydrogenase
MRLKKVGVVGAGQMGSGIGQVIASRGIQVTINDVSSTALEKAISKITSSCDRLIKKNKLAPEEKIVILDRISVTTDMEDLEDSEFVIEAATEKMDLKMKIFKKLDEVCDKEAIIATNTSSLSVTQLAAVTKRPDKVIGMHFMNPVPLMPLVEVIRGLATSDGTFNRVADLTRRLGKILVEAKDYPGFIVNRILMPMINEACYAVYESVGEIGEIDQAMKMGTNQPMGPLELADFIGLDTCLAIMEVLHEGFSDTKYRPCPLLRKYVEAGWLGRKSGRGFYDYSEL